MSVRLTKLTLASPHLLLGSLTCGLLVTAELDERGFQRLMQEDGWAEWATFAAFAVAACFRLASARHVESGFEKLWTVGLGLFCVFVAGEEISWGQRLVGYRPPDFFLEQNFQQEANVHNLLKGILDTRFIVLGIAVIYGVLGPVLRYLALLPRALVPAAPLIPYFALVAWLELSYPYELVGELAELLLGLAFAFDAAERRAPLPTTSAATAASGQAFSLAAALLLVPINDAVVALHGERFAVTARSELEHIADRMRDSTTLRDRLFKKQHVHKRMYTAARVGYLALPAGEYALDPWNNPYWLAFRRESDGSGKVLVYSFGANHRRETDVDRFGGESFALAGDDLGVVLRVERQVRADKQ